MEFGGQSGSKNIRLLVVPYTNEPSLTMVTEEIQQQTILSTMVKEGNLGNEPPLTMVREEKSGK
jgi:hypothetical protein